jgi:DNA-binding beta-propeller fold protein YncE
VQLCSLAGVRTVIWQLGIAGLVFASITTQAQAQTFQLFPTPVRAMEYNPADGSLYAAGEMVNGTSFGKTRTIWRIDPATTTVINSVDAGSTITNIKLAPSGDYLYEPVDRYRASALKTEDCNSPNLK